MVSSLTFSSIIHFKIIFGVREYSNFIDLFVAVQFSQYDLLKRDCRIDILASSVID